MLWFLVMVTSGAGYLARHVLALPTPAAALLAPSLAAMRRDDQKGRWLAVHVLYAECRCSRRVTDHLLSSARPTDWSEIVLWVTAEESQALAAPAALRAAFDVRVVSPLQLSRMGIEAAPLLALVDPQGVVRYAGGYTERKQGPDIEDLRLFAAARRAERLDALPLFGCAVSGRLKEQLAKLPTL